MVALAYAPSGRYLAWGTGGGGLCLFDLREGKRIVCVPAHKELVTGLGFSPDGKRLTSVGRDGNLRVWEVPTGKPIRSFSSKQAKVLFAAATADGTRLAVGSADRKVRVWDAVTGKLLWQADVDQSKLTPFPASVGLLFAPDGKSIVIGRREARPPPVRSDDVFELRETATGQVRATWRGNWVTGLDFTRDGKAIALTTDQSGLRVIDLPSGLTRQEIESGSGGCVAVAPDGKHAVTAARAMLFLWEVGSGKEVASPGLARAAVQSVVYLPDGKRLGVLREDYTFTLWDVQAAKVLRQFNEPVRPYSRRGAAYCPKRNLLARSIGSGTVALDDMDRGRRVLTIQPENVVPVYDNLCFSPDGTRLVAWTGGTWLFDTRKGEVVAAYRRGERPRGPYCLFSPDGIYLSGADSEGKPPFAKDDCVLVLREARTGKVAAHYLGSKKYWTSLAFSPDGRFIAAVCLDRFVRVWEVSTGKELWHCRSGRSGQEFVVAFSPDSRALATARSGRLDDPTQDQVVFWHAQTGQRIGQFSTEQIGVHCLAFRPDGKALATAGVDQTIRLWDVARLGRDTQPRPAELSKAEQRSLWDDLAGQDAAKAYRACRRWVGGGQQTVVFFRARLRPAVPLTAVDIAKQLERLEDDDFNVRNEAVEALAALRPEADVALELALKRAAMPETRRRLQTVLDQPTLLVREPERLRAVRAVLVLEQIATPAARQVLEALAKGHAQARLTVEAGRALARLAPPKAQ